GRRSHPVEHHRGGHDGPRGLTARERDRVLAATVSPCTNRWPATCKPSPVELLRQPPTFEDATPLHDRFDRIAPHAVPEVSPRRHVQDQEVRELSGFQAPDVALPS